MTFWQENYGFVKEVYDFRCSKYLEWMDNIEAIIGKVMANTQYTAKEFKIIKDTFTVGTFEGVSAVEAVVPSIPVL